MRIELKGICKKFDHDEIFHGIDEIFESKSSTAILGLNGSGKSTLLQIISGFVMPSKGEIVYVTNETVVENDDIFHYISFCSPYLELIEEMTLLEFLDYHFFFKKALISTGEMIALIGLSASKYKLIDKFSSGMKQRVKLAQAIFADTPALLLDEPCSNLDADGIELYHQLIQQYAQNKTVLVASNDKLEYGFCQQQLYVQDFKTHKLVSNE